MLFYILFPYKLGHGVPNEQYVEVIKSSGLNMMQDRGGGRIKIVCFL